MTAQATTYAFLRSVGANHATALWKVTVGNWNPYTEAQPTASAEALAETEQMLIAEGVFAR